MGEDRTGAGGPPTKRRYTVAEAAAILNTTGEAVRSRIQRGTLESVKDGTHVYVLLSPDQTTDQTPPKQQPNTAPSQSDTTALISRLEDEVRFLREELARKDAILLRMAESIPQLQAPASPETPESPEISGPSPTPPGTREGPHAASERPFTEEEPERRGFWSRLFGQ